MNPYNVLISILTPFDRVDELAWRIGGTAVLKQLASALIEQLEANGYEAYFVGGCVRDWILHRPVHDIDICTNAHPCDVSRIFPQHIPTGLKHGTVSVKHEGHLFEITTFRTEGAYTDFRRPDEVQFVTDITEDLARRDFTINAMAMNRADELIDPFGGKVDLENRVIRAVGDPVTRFREDALRLLRAARFSAQLGFEIEGQTRQAMRETAPLLSRIAVERIREELFKLLDSEYPECGIEVVNQTALLQVFPVLHNLFQTMSAQVWRLTRLSSIQQKMAFACYAGDLKVEATTALCDQLRLSKKDREMICRFVSTLSQVKPVWDQPQSIEWGPILLEQGREYCRQIDELLQVIWWENRDPSITSSLIKTDQQMPIHSIRELAITGLDLQQALNRKSGDWIKRTLQRLLYQVAFCSLPNTPEDLLLAARKEVETDEHQTGDS